MANTCTRSSGTLAVILPLLLLPACERSSTDPATEPLSAEGGAVASAATAATPAGLAQDVRAITSRYHSKQQAIRDGYAEDPHCVEDPTMGGMGHHWVNGALVDSIFDPSRPEAVLYAPDRNGRPQLVAVEYIVLDVGQPAPTFGGQPFDVGGTPVPVPHWSLHLWVHRTNPAGMFTPFNPAVDCQ